MPIYWYDFYEGDSAKIYNSTEEFSKMLKSYPPIQPHNQLEEKADINLQDKHVCLCPFKWEIYYETDLLIADSFQELRNMWQDRHDDI